MIQLKEHNLKELLKKIAEQLGGKLMRSGNTYIFKVDNEKAKGCITGHVLSPGLDALIYDITFFKETKFDIDETFMNPIYFLFFLEGQIIHQFKNGKQSHLLEAYNNIILHSPKDKRNFTTVAPGVHIKMSDIHVLKKQIKKNQRGSLYYLTEALKQMFADFNTDKIYDYKGLLSGQTANYLKLLIENDKKGVVGKLFVEASILNILSSQIGGYEAYQKDNPTIDSISKKELSKILYICDFIVDNLSEKISIDKLTKLSGLSPVKLQAGFKYLYKQSVYEYIRDVRLETAMNLISNTNLTLSEITYLIGLSSRSYFTRIFKERYNILPKDFKKLKDTSLS
ncbi:AraC family transcriptional regulator [Aquimarina sp. ERC-38]|uniref:AraC family transcriptional regulator n=1 Tax=Aquimarina sp. ERC-38 TaxID=2949996 RepID=UPI002245D392|nr:AraC family transcriptional regulator [Aquimarina sp. ERC-38]UZO82271.1 AraC family transcriptional regulator [Aquimarina sp. ERC-38]